MKLIIVLSIILTMMATTQAIRHRKKPGFLDYASSLYTDFIPKLSHLLKIGFPKGGFGGDKHKHHHKKTDTPFYGPYLPGYFDHDFYDFPHYASFYTNYFPYQESFIGHINPYFGGHNFDHYNLHEFI